VLTFDVDSIADVDSSIIRAVTLGVKLVKPVFRTSYGFYQGVLLDPEENDFRINAVLCRAVDVRCGRKFGMTIEALTDSGLVLVEVA
jgi:hypothetical protein